MVLPAPASDTGAATAPAWLAKLIAQLERARRGILFALVDATPTQLGPVVRALSEVSAWDTDTVDPATLAKPAKPAKPAKHRLVVCVRAHELLDVEPGSRVLLRVVVEDLEWLNLHRPIFADRELRAILWVEPATLDGLVREAVDLFDWVSRAVPVPSEPLPGFARDAVRAALSVGAAFSWQGWGLDEQLAELKCEVLELHASTASWELVELLRKPGLPVVSGLRHERDAWRMRMLLAWAGRDGSWVARDPGEVLTGLWPLHARQQNWDEATAMLRAAGRPHPGLLAAWVELEPEWIEWLAAYPDAGADAYDFDAVVRETAPVWMLRRHAGEDAVVGARALLVSDTDVPPEDLASQVIWARGRQAWDDAQEGDSAPRLVRALRVLGASVPAPELVQAAKAAGFEELGVALGLVRWNVHADSRADELVAWLQDHGHTVLALDVASEWRDRAVGADDLESSASASRAVGNLQLHLGRPAVSLAAFERAVEAFRGAIDRQPEGPERSGVERSLVNCLAYLGDLHRDRGDVDEALRCFEDALAIGRALVARAPENLDHSTVLSDTLDRLGKLHRRRGDDVHAGEYLGEALALARELSRRAPERPDFRRNVAVSLESVGDLYVDLGELDEARAKFEESLAIRVSALAGDPESSVLRRALAVSYEHLGELHREVGDLDQAHEQLRANLDLRESLAKREPQRPDLQLELAAALRQLATVLLSLGDIEQASAHLERSLVLVQALTESDLELVEAQRERSMVIDRLADLHELAGDLEQALEVRMRVRALDDHLVEQDPENVALRRDRAAGRFQIGLLYEQLGDRERASDSVRSAMAEYRLLAERMPGRIDLKHQLALLLAHVGILDEDVELLRDAHALLHELRALGVLQPAYEALAESLDETFSD